MGRLADGSAFFDREEIMARAWNLLETSNLLLLAPRRVGKSSLLNRLHKDGPAKGYNTLYLSVPDAEDELDFIKRLVRGFRDAPWASRSWISVFKDRLPGDLEVVVKTSLIELKAKNFDWRKPADELGALLKAGGQPTLLLIDELPLLIGSIVQQDPTGGRAERFLLWLKRLREQYEPRWFFAGSIGLDSVARKFKLSGTIHDLQTVELGEFSPEKAREYLLGRGHYHQMELDEVTVEAILQAVEWHIPFHLNLVFEELRTVIGDARRTPTPALVEMALKGLMAHGRTHFDHWDERLAKILDRRVQDFSEIVLALACRDAKGVTVETIDLRLSKELTSYQERTDIMRQLLDLLMSDGYLVRQEGLVRFRSALLRRYWREVSA